MFRTFDIMVLLLTFVSFLFSIYLWFGGNREEGLYVGLWVTSIIGVGMITTPGVTFRMFQSLARKNINIQVISTSEIKISVLIKRTNVTKAIKCLHQEFNLDK